MQTGILPVYLSRNNVLGKGTFPPSVKCCWGAHGLSFHRQMLQIKYKRERPSRTASSRSKRFCILIGKGGELWEKKNNNKKGKVLALFGQGKARRLSDSPKAPQQNRSVNLDLPKGWN